MNLCAFRPLSTGYAFTNSPDSYPPIEMLATELCQPSKVGLLAVGTWQASVSISIMRGDKCSAGRTVKTAKMAREQLVGGRVKELRTVPPIQLHAYPRLLSNANASNKH